MQALILAGGKGTRLRPYTAVIPKPLMPVGDMPILSIILKQLARAGVTDVILAVNYLHHLFGIVLDPADHSGMDIQYSLEDKELGTAGPISMVLDKLEDNFLVMNGDILTTLDYGALLKYHMDNQCAATISVHRREVHIDYGVIHSTDTGELVDYEEKPTLGYDVSMGINVFNRDAVTSLIKPNEYLDIPDLMVRLSKAGHKVCCRRDQSYWLDIGRIEDYETANAVFDSKRAEFLG